jgi:hypothetical protein
MRTHAKFEVRTRKTDAVYSAPSEGGACSIQPYLRRPQLRMCMLSHALPGEDKGGHHQACCGGVHIRLEHMPGGGPGGGRTASQTSTPSVARSRGNQRVPVERPARGRRDLPVLCQHALHLRVSQAVCGTSEQARHARPSRPTELHATYNNDVPSTHHHLTIVAVALRRPLRAIGVGCVPHGRVRGVLGESASLHLGIGPLELSRVDALAGVLADNCMCMPIAGREIERERVRVCSETRKLTVCATRGGAACTHTAWRSAWR